MTKTVQRFAWLPITVWNMKTKDFEYTFIWLCWYWDTGKQNSSTLYRLTDEDKPPMMSHRFLRTNTNRW